MIKIVIGAAIGMALGGLIGYFGKCRGGSCPISCNPWGGLLFGGLFGAMIAYAFSGGITMSKGDKGAYEAIPQISTLEQFDSQVLKSPRPVLVDFYTDWCGYCKELAPTIGTLSKDYQGKVDFAKVNGDKTPDILRRYPVEGYPTVMIFSGGKPVKTWPGMQSEQTLRDGLDEVLRGFTPAKASATSPTTTQGANMATPQKRTVTMKGNPLMLSGTEVKVGDKAPDFTAVGNDLKEVKLSDFKGKVCILSAVPSLDTPVCSIETRRFNEEAAKLGKDIVILTISMDLPFAQKRWCGAEGVDKVITISDHRDAAFGNAYGVLIPNLRLLARCVFVVDPSGVIRHVQLVPEISKEPDYAAVLSAARSLVAN